MVEAGSSKFNRISFEDIQRALRGSKSMRTAVARLLAQEFSSELSKHLEITARKATKSARKK